MKRLAEIYEAAMKEGRKIDLTGCNYGETDGCAKFIGRPTNYYYFLAGFVKTQRLRYILEIGTHFGGSIMSMARSMRNWDARRSRIVTVDISRKNEEGFKNYPRIKRLQGDSTSGEIVEELTGTFNKPIDLLYIDSLHEYDHAKRNIEIYSRMLKPKYIILDDIRLSGAMQRLWSEMLDRFGENASDISLVVGRREAGFGIIRYR